MKNKCKYKDIQGYCRHKRNQEKGRTQMKCCEKGCPYMVKEENSELNKNGGKR